MNKIEMPDDYSRGFISGWKHGASAMLADAIHELRKGSAERKTLEGLLLPQYPLPVPPEIDTWIIEIGGGYGRYEFVGTEEEADIERRRKAKLEGAVGRKWRCPQRTGAEPAP